MLVFNTRGNKSCISKSHLHGIYMGVYRGRQKDAKSLQTRMDSGLPGGDRTPDPQLRRLLLYPTELRTVDIQNSIKKAQG